jgi:uncharacterized SAM-binding protein YcdF (DUF218 family)
VNELFVMLGIESWKPVVSALVLPPVPLLVLVLVGAGLLRSRRVLGWLLVAVAVAGLWFSATLAAGYGLERALLAVPPPLSPERLDALRREAKAQPGSAIVVLGGGMEPLAPEFGVASLTDLSLQRLRYGLWLARETGLPVAFSGGTGWSAASGASEGETAARIAAQEFGRPLRWVEGESRDTRGNAARTVPMLRGAGVRHIVLVTHGWHMPRARRAFEAAAASAGLRIEPAPMGLARTARRPAFDWMPSAAGFMRVRHVLHEAIGRAGGA